MANMDKITIGKALLANDKLRIFNMSGSNFGQNTSPRHTQNDFIQHSSNNYKYSSKNMQKSSSVMITNSSHNNHQFTKPSRNDTMDLNGFCTIRSITESSAPEENHLFKNYNQQNEDNKNKSQQKLLQTCYTSNSHNQGFATTRTYTTNFYNASPRDNKNYDNKITNTRSNKSTIRALNTMEDYKKSTLKNLLHKTDYQDEVYSKPQMLMIKQNVNMEKLVQFDKKKMESNEFMPLYSNDNKTMVDVIRDHNENTKKFSQIKNSYRIMKKSSTADMNYFSGLQKVYESLEQSKKPYAQATKSFQLKKKDKYTDIVAIADKNEMEEANKKKKITRAWINPEKKLDLKDSLEDYSCRLDFTVHKLKTSEKFPIVQKLEHSLRKKLIVDKSKFSKESLHNATSESDIQEKLRKTFFDYVKNKKSEDLKSKLSCSKYQDASSVRTKLLDSITKKIIDNKKEIKKVPYKKKTQDSDP